MFTSELPKGYTCLCGAEHAFHVWVFSHWDIPLTHTCEKCGSINTIQRGVRINVRSAKGKNRRSTGKPERSDAANTTGGSGT